MTYNIHMDETSLALGEKSLPVRRGKAANLAWGWTTISIVISFLAVLTTIRGVLTSGDYRTVLSHETITPFITILYAVTGGLVASRRPRNPIGWIFVSIGFIGALGALANAVNRYGSSGTLVVEWATWLDSWLWIPGIFLPMTFVILIFPDGHLPSPRFRLVAWSSAFGMVALILATILQPGPLAALILPPNASGSLAVSHVLDGMIPVGSVLFVIGFFGSLAGFFVRFHRSAGMEREQMKWLLYAIGIEAFTIVLSIILGLVWPKNPLIREIIIALSGVDVLCIVIAAAIAILRHRLYDIDLIINRTLVYTSLTVGVIALYGFVVGGLGVLFQASGNLLISLIATGLAAILVQPMRDRLQRGVNRLMYGERDDPYAVLLHLNRQLEGSLSPESVLPTVVETVAKTLKLPFVAIALKQEGALKIVARYGASGDESFQIPLIDQGETVGQLRLSTRSPGESFTPGEQRLLGDIARHIGVTAHTVLLTQDLRRLAEDLQRSREELVKNREEERRRLRRDLHDELGPQLASIKLNLDVARNLVSRDPAAAEALLIDLRTQSQAAIADIRRLVFDLRPPALDELGLIGAIQEYARQIVSQDGLKIRLVQPEELPPLPAAVEVAAYRITLEALANFVRHSQGSHCQITVSQKGEKLQIEVCDDGLGLPRDLQQGVGLNSMRERAAELGGSCEIRTLPQGGTLVLARLPLV
jgi:signal transduction histidine kinase